MKNQLNSYFKSNLSSKLLFSSLIFILIAILIIPDDLMLLITLLCTSYLGFDNSSIKFQLIYIQTRLDMLAKFDATNIPELLISNFSKEELLRLSQNLSIPVVIRGAIKDSIACKRWNQKYLMKSIPSDNNLLVREIFNESHVRIDLKSLKDFYWMKNKGKNLSAIGSSSLFYRVKSLKSDLYSPIDDYLNELFKTSNYSHQIYITSSGRSEYHSEIGNNIIRQISGRKLWTLINPAYNLFMCPTTTGSATGISMYSCTSKFTPQKREEWFERIPRMSSILEPGDVLIYPGWWWHEVQTLGKIKETVSTLPSSYHFF